MSFGQHQRNAFSLLELLVSIGVIGVLLAITAPALRGARKGTGEIKSLANLSQIGLTFEQYLAQHDQAYPVMLEGRQYTWNAPGATGSMMHYNGRWISAHFWFLVIGGVAPWQEHIQTWISPGVDMDEATKDGGFIPSYRYSHSFIASPRLWTAEGAAHATPATQAGYLSGAHSSQVAYPSGKVMLYDHALAYIRRTDKPRYLGLPDIPTPMVFADSHAAVHLPRAAASPVRNVLNLEQFADAPLYNTPEGVLGRDY